MLGKLVKGLSGLGGAAALTTGGVFLKNHVERKNFLFNSDKKAKILEGNDGLVKLFMSNMEEELLKRLWIREVGKKLWKIGTLDEMKEGEKETWEKITRNESEVGSFRYIKIEEWELEKIEREYTEYWERYREACLTWNLSRKEGYSSSNDPICYAWYTAEEYRGYDEYKEYKKLKEGGLNLDIKEFYWTIWKKFKNDKKHEIKKEDEADSNVPSLFATWKQESENAPLFTASQ